MRMTEMMSSEQFSTIKADLPLEAMPVKGGSVYDMTDSQKRMARMGQQIAAGLSPRSSDIKWPDDQQWLDALHFSNELIRAGSNSTMDDVLRRSGISQEKADAIMDKVAKGDVDITKSVPDPEGEEKGAERLAKAIAKA